MKLSKKIGATCCALVISLGSAIAVQAVAVSGTELMYNGGQNSTVVYSSIFDTKPSTGVKYAVLATVKVGGSTFNSGWVNDSAYIEHNRSFWSNESSLYDYYIR